LNIPTDLPSDSFKRAYIGGCSAFGSTLFRDFAETFDKPSKRSGLIENKSVRPIYEILVQNKDQE
jgi:hypothetical protein